MKYVNKPVRKKDAMQLVTGKPVYMDDIAPKDCLIVKLLRSPHANAIVTSINKIAAMKVDGIEAIYSTYTTGEEQYVKRLAKENGLLISGGSDFHGTNKPTIQIGTGRGHLYIPYSVLETIKEHLRA